ncbi:MAG: uroporphyrinogen decarboxylase family protein [Planctomycetota bacterium]
MGLDRKAIAYRAINHQETSLCPYTFSAEDVVARELDAYYGYSSWRNKYHDYVVACAGFDEGVRWDAPGCSKDIYGTVWRTDRRPAHIEAPVLKTPSLRGYRFPDPETIATKDWAENARAEIARHADCLTVGRLGAGLFERSWMMRGFLDLLTDVAAEPAFFEDLLAAIADHQLQLVDRLLELPLDGIMFSDDWGDQRGVIIGPERWRQFIKPNVATLYAKAKAAGKIVLTHCCGSIVDIMPDVIEIGLDVLQSVQPEAHGMNPYKLKERYGRQLTFWGGLGSQSIVPFGTPRELRSEIRMLASRMGRGGGYMLAPAKALMPETPTENAAAILEEFMALGEPA